MSPSNGEDSVTSLRIWDASPTGASPLRWSERAPAVYPRHTVVSVEIASGGHRAEGVAGLTHYEETPDASVNPSIEGLSSWLGFPLRALPHHPAGGHPYGRMPHPLEPVVALAALDALGRVTNLPVATYLGGVSRMTIPAYASLPSFTEPSAAVACAAAAVDAGFRTVKFHGSGFLDVDLETITKARRHLGDSIGMIWDASCAYELGDAEIVGNWLMNHDFLWFEAPLGSDSAPAMRRLAPRLGIPLVPDGMMHRSVGDWSRDLGDGVWGALRLDVTRTLGLPEALQLLRLAEGGGFTCEIQSFGFALSQYANLHLMLATPACRFFEAPFPTGDLDDGLVAPPAVIDGSVSLPAGSGLGHGVGHDGLSSTCRVLAELS